jgi:hypothetical protein
MITKPNTKDAFAFGFNATSSAKMAMTTMLTSTMIGGFAQREDIDMYHAAPIGPRGRQDGEEGHDFASGGGSPLP